MSIQMSRSFGEIKLVHKDGDEVTFNLKYIPAIGEIGICIDNDSVNAPYSFWLETSASLGTKLLLIDEEYHWLRSGEALRLVKAIEDWIA
ncbi:hypothetical protein AU156_gp110 [Edwardsiella phage PEi20]|uniref:Uncharacterized protein n=1 Tax=Edwardsiella phage PEi20 TaxID=1608310 RepID=A0A0B6VSN9_9CAUD|nr:hypothetical protein AU156_gp110 [Edwardsiella phage PEi20]BAQ22760.1 conserved hypothetical protein [Edwardsiella phage PEi20]